jgi:phosphopantothenoylcysteine decarboxylase/phosphopantothenate--cysteine ligase
MIPTFIDTFINKDYIVEPMDLKSKELVANDIMNKVISFYEMSTESK